jgi:predicted RNase H-related nuclease YkuK (DUF458 family)
MSNQLKIFTDTSKNDYHILDEYDSEVYGHKILENDRNIVLHYVSGSGEWFYPLDSVQRTIEELRSYTKNRRYREEHTIPRLKIFLWAEERMIHHIREKKLKSILES